MGEEVIFDKSGICCANVFGNLGTDGKHFFPDRCTKKAYLLLSHYLISWNTPLAIDFTPLDTVVSRPTSEPDDNPKGLTDVE